MNHAGLFNAVLLVAIATPDVPAAPPDVAVTQHDILPVLRLQPPRRDIVVPSSDAGSANAIDAFLLRKLTERGLTLSDPASRRVLVRRAYFDLTGLPPTPEETAAFLADSRPDAYERLLDRLLASPRHGERWGRIWLDVAGYSDSEGKTHQDYLREHSYRYRDYVIRAHNADKPLDRFLLEQIAGDELADYEGAAEITQELYDNLVATSFLRQGPDGTWANITGFVPDRLEVIADAIDVLGRGVLGLTLNCARCHSHKFDPLPQRDYYRLAAMLKGALDEHDWLKPQGDSKRANPGLRFLPFVTTAEKNEWQARIDAIAKEKAAAEARLAKATAEFRRRYQEKAEKTATATTKINSDQPTVEELKKAFPEFKKLADTIAGEVAALEKKKPAQPLIRALWDRGAPSPTHILERGSYLRVGERVYPGVPSVLLPDASPVAIGPPWPGSKKSGRRLALANWLISPHHPLTARVAVNRIWKHHFANGIVKSLGNFGRTGTPPTHPKLLDWLAVEFVRDAWSMKRLHRRIMTSRAYRQSSAVLPATAQRDPANRLIGRFPLKRLDAESVRDAVLHVAGRLRDAPFGPPDAVGVRPDGLVTVRSHGSDAAESWRRSIYVLQRRKQIPTFLEAFDLAQMNPNCLDRPSSTVVTQALYLLNNATVQKLAGFFAERVREAAGDDPESQIRRAFLSAFGRQPSAEELSATLDSYLEAARLWRTHMQTVATAAQARRRALENICHAVFNSAEFIYVD